ncbi:hypothetical protein ACFXD5_02115 [Streptomyces sp. NPDC059385]|uniref:hypothetical protein n=1 Tax=Streptomyces sp. NPDC059385 TaxID=3346817 RepID=UPI00368E304D
MSLFDSVDHYCARYRPRLPDRVVQLPAREPTRAATPRLLDLGAGAGQVALSMLPVLPPTTRMDLVDQDEGMLRTALGELRPRLGERTARAHAVPLEEQAHALLLEHARDGALNEDGAFTVLRAHLPGVAR